MLASPQELLEALRRHCERTAALLQELQAKRPAWLQETLRTTLAALLAKPAQLTLADVQPVAEQLERAAPKEVLTQYVTRMGELVESSPHRSA